MGVLALAHHRDSGALLHVTDDPHRVICFGKSGHQRIRPFWRHGEQQAASGAKSTWRA